MEPGERFAREAAELRACAAALRGLKPRVGTLLDKQTTTATAPGLWQGPAVDDLVARIRAMRARLHGVAADIETTARSLDEAAAMREAHATAIREALERVEREEARR